MGRELGGGSGWGTHVNPWLIHGNVWQRLLQYCKVVSLKKKKKKNLPAKTHRRCRFDSWVGKIPLEEEMAIHSSSHAWEIPWTEEPGRLVCGVSKSQTRQHAWMNIQGIVFCSLVLLFLFNQDVRYIYFPCQTAVARTSSTMLNRSGDNRYFCFWS